MAVEDAPLFRVQEARLILSARRSARIRVAQRAGCSIREVVLLDE
jgi:hypothetical protein